MRLKLVSLEDGTTACGFRKFAAHAARLNEDTSTYYVSTSRWASIVGAIKGTMGGKPEMGAEQVDEVARGLMGSDVVGFSSMSGYSDLTAQIITRLRELAPETFILWGGIHPIIHPEDAILSDVDAICTGEGEFAFEQLLAHLREGTDHTAVKNFWFKDRVTGEVRQNRFLPLMSSQDMEGLEHPLYGDDREHIYEGGTGFRPMTTDDYLANDGLSYTALWSIGCPFHCTYCGNTAFIANDKAYKKIRHPSARYIVDEIKAVRARFPHLSQVSFLDDSFMAIGYRELEAFAELWEAELGIPFAVYGVIPNYVKRDKIQVLTWAGMNRVRMGVQSGSARILDFYQRPSPPPKILAAGEVLASFAPKFHIPPAYDIIMDNPIETRSDVRETLQLLYDMPRPYTLLIYSLKVIPNTELARSMTEQGIDLEAIDSSYMWIPARWANLMLYLVAIWRPPPWLWKRLLGRVRASSEDQKLYPRLGIALRTAFLVKRGLLHVRVMDFSIIPGRSGWWAWKLGLIGLYQRRFDRRPDRPPPRPRPRREIVLPVVEQVEPPLSDAA